MSKRQRQKARAVALSMPRKNGRFVKRLTAKDFNSTTEYRIEEKLDLLILNMYSVKQRLEELEDLIRIK